MLILLFLFFAVVLFGLKFTSKGTANYLSVENTQGVKCVFILMVFYSHFNSYISLTDSIYDTVYIKFFRFIGQAMVAMFLFYSGYGVMESITRKGESYILKIPKNRILKTLVNFDFAVLLFLVLNLIINSKISLKQVMLSLIGWDSLGNSNWYIFVILMLYTLRFLVFSVIRKETKSARLSSVFVLTALICGLILVTYRFNIRPTYWYDTALCYALGMGYSLVKEYVEKAVNKNFFLWLFSLLLSAAAFVVLKGHNVFIEIAANLCFTVSLVIFTMRITLNNKVLKWCGEHLFEIYILQRIPMIIFQKVRLSEWNIYIYFTVCVAVTALLCIVFKYLTTKFWKAVKL